MLEFYVTKGQELKRRDHDVVSADTTDLKAQFDLTSDFTGTITVWWRRSDKPGSTWTSTLSGNQCTIPAEALSAATDNVMYGEYDHFVFVSISDTGRTTSSECEIKVNKSVFSTNATPGTGGNPTAYEELVEQFDELKADNQTFKDSMTEQQETFENTVTENVDNIRYVVETETAPPIIEEASGAEITLDDSAYRQVRGLQLYGYSKQTQTTGAQLIDAANADWRVNHPSGNASSTFQRTETGIDFTVTYITPSSGVYLHVFEIGKSYHISFDVLFSDTNFHNFRYGIDSIMNVSEIQAGKRKHIESDIINADETAVVFYLYPLSTGTQVTIENLMISEGTESKPFEPYSGGVASPSPDWAQPIRSVGDGGSVTVESAGANLIDLPKNLVSSYGGISVKALGDGSFSYSGTATGQQINVWLAGNYKATTPIITLKKGKYSAPFSGALLYDYDYGLNLTGFITVPDGGRDITGIRAPSAVTGTYYNKIIYPMLNRGSTPRPWQPYVAPSSALITLTDSLRGIPVTSGGTYTDESGQQWIADYIYRRQTDGKWCLWRNIKCAEYDGSTDEVWNVSVGGDNIFTTSDFSGVPLNGLCNRFRYKNNPESAGEFEFDANHSFRFYTDLNGVPAWRTWLQSNPLEVVYQIATPTIEELPENVQTELNGLYTYNLHTDMWNDDGAYMNLKYVADTKTWINNKIAGLSTAMLNQN